MSFYHNDLNISFYFYPAPYFFDKIDYIFLNRKIQLDGYSELIFMLHYEKLFYRAGYKTTYFDGNGLFESMFIRIIDQYKETIKDREEILLLIHLLNLYQLLKLVDHFDRDSYEFIYKYRLKIKKENRNFYKQNFGHVCRYVKENFNSGTDKFNESLEMLFSSVILYLYIKNFVRKK